MSKFWKTMLTTVIIALAMLAVAWCCGGCVYKGGKITEGTDLSVGINVPTTDGALQLQVLNYLSGFRLGVAENAKLTMKYTVSETNSYLGCISTCVSKTVDATVEPCEDTLPTSDGECDPDGVKCDPDGAK